VSSLDAALVWLDSGVCSQNPGHSFWLDGRPLPLCARNLGLFGAFLLASSLLARFRLRPNSYWLVGLVPLLIDGANSFAAGTLGLGLYAPGNLFRLATGVLAGVCLALAAARHLPRAPLWPPVALAILLLLPTLALQLALLGAAGVLSLLAFANTLARPALQPGFAWALTLPELATLALLKHSALALLG